MEKREFVIQHLKKDYHIFRVSRMVFLVMALALMVAFLYTFFQRNSFELKGYILSFFIGVIILYPFLLTKENDCLIALQEYMQDKPQEEYSRQTVRALHPILHNPKHLLFKGCLIGAIVIVLWVVATIIALPWEPPMNRLYYMISVLFYAMSIPLLGLTVYYFLDYRVIQKYHAIPNDEGE